MPDESEIKTSELRVIEVDKDPGNVVFLGLGEASWNKEDMDDFYIIRLRMQRKLLDLWDNIEEILREAGFTKKRIDEIVTENEEPIRIIRSRFELI